VHGPHKWRDGEKWIFEICPWSENHRNRSAYIVRFANGALGAGCHHDGCQAKGWRELRLLFEPDAYINGDRQTGASPHSSSSKWDGTRPSDEGMAFTPVGDLLAEPDERVEWIVEGLLRASGLSALVAKPKVGKSTLARCLSLAVSRGEQFLGRATTQGRVLYLALEESRGQVKAHFRALGATDADDVRIYANRAPVDALRELRAAILENGPKLVVIDTLFRLTRVKDANDYAQVTAALDPLLALARELGTHVMFLHHSPKGNPRQAVEAALGSIAITGTVDIVVVLRKTDRFRTILTEQREGQGFPDEVTLDFDSDTRSVSLGPSRKAADEQETAVAIVEWLKTQTDPVVEKAILEAVEGRTLTKQRALRALVSARQVIRSGEGKRGAAYLYSLSTSEHPNRSRDAEIQKSKSPENPRAADDNSASGGSFTSNGNGMQHPNVEDAESGEPLEYL
jgi:hypothetical protein